MPTEIRPGQTWECNEERAVDADDTEPAWTKHHPANPFGPAWPCFRAGVETVDGDYVVLSVSMKRRAHTSNPEIGASIVKTPTTLREDPRWQLHERAPSNRGGE